MERDNAYGTPRATLETLIADAGLTLAVVFVPYSQSRNAAEKWKSLNWRVTLQRNGRNVLTTDYSAGIAHCPAYKSPTKFATGKVDQYVTNQRIAREIETGRAAPNSYATGAAILPDTVDVIASLVNEADVLDAGGFESWAGELGYDTDSRKAHSIYTACLEHAIALRGALGETLLNPLREAARDL